ncbi:MAG TPA: hypothetical protein DEF43_03820 [Chloroflexus aurantiacus]|jgi:hypothetical protein|uniref:Uncharacterized protein n=1 Tax=Chloroflexus aurantiacus (strain ATCC 29366 / DSM 635 / J-10-fl) TaxID=324602 RepID=A9WF56_CHLAA|nr:MULTISPECIES: hypothetical protein [Chloroflexus]ABY35371.1 hypothetical protein Caur_2159 [Chloroflexus aurantiacus J-10-fl]RMG51868.1 MAG: hypothetical protein D6716_05020 [Chloroflexota bacterium]GIV92206.1 MAG: hypothetical protein KatS3mg056_0915 [Chloroflexus sp.]HBW66285.1 hypothetical protein [Chloroflexus aurantiacus]
MNDPLANLLARSFGSELRDSVQPRLPSRFEVPVASDHAYEAVLPAQPTGMPDSALPLMPPVVPAIPPPITSSAPGATAPATSPVHRGETLSPPNHLLALPTIDGVPAVWGQSPTGVTPQMNVPPQGQRESAPRTDPAITDNHPLHPARAAWLPADVAGAPTHHVAPDEPVSAVGRAATLQPQAEARPERLESVMPLIPAASAETGPSPAPRSPRISITIGRIEVRAAPPVTIPPAQPRSRQTRPALTLDEYLRRRDGGKR